MKKIISGLSVVALFIILALGNIGGCGDGDSPCDFEFNAFLNGATFMDQDSEWDCKRGGETVFTLGFFGDSTGTRSDIGDFIYDRNKCRTVQFENEDGEGKLNNMEGNSILGTLSFNQVSDDFGDTAVVCDLVEF